MKKFLFLDCDSTICAIEGVDELAALKGTQTEADVIALTNQAMDGTVPIHEIFARRLDLICPTRAMCKQVGEMYIAKLSPNVESTLVELRAEGWQPIIISGGFTQVIEPVAQYLDITEIFAVDLQFDENGDYLGFNESAPTARNGGKPDLITTFLQDKGPCQTIMMGDGVSDLETQELVDLFIGFGGVVIRDRVKKEASAFIHNFEELPQTIKQHF